MTEVIDDHTAFVLYERNFRAGPPERELYHNMETFKRLNDAFDFAFAQQPARVGAKLRMNKETLQQVWDPERPYIVVAEHTRKYCTSFMGEKEYGNSYEVVRSSSDGLESKIEKMAKEKHVVGIRVGLDVRYL